MPLLPKQRGIERRVTFDIFRKAETRGFFPGVAAQFGGAGSVVQQPQHGLRQAPRVLTVAAGVIGMAALLGDLGKGMQHIRQEPCQPDALALALNAA